MAHPPSPLEGDLVNDSPVLLGTQQRERAAIMVADGTYTNQKIADACGIDKRTVSRWRNEDPLFAKRVAEIVRLLTEQLSTIAIAQRITRVKRLDTRWSQTNHAIDLRREHAEAHPDHPLYVMFPEAVTGLYGRKIIERFDKDGVHVATEYELTKDPLLDTEMALAKQAAQELGQWSEKRESTIQEDVTFTLVIDRTDRSLAE